MNQDLFHRKLIDLEDRKPQFNTFDNIPLCKDGLPLILDPQAKMDVVKMTNILTTAYQY